MYLYRRISENKCLAVSKIILLKILSNSKPIKVYYYLR